MVNIDEAQALDQVRERLTAQFPDVPEDTVRLVVDQAHRSLDGRPVRNYVPVLVEREARERLRAPSGSTRTMSARR